MHLHATSGVPSYSLLLIPYSLLLTPTPAAAPAAAATITGLLGDHDTIMAILVTVTMVSFLMTSTWILPAVSWP